VLCDNEFVYYILVFIYLFIINIHKLFNEALSKLHYTAPNDI